MHNILERARARAHTHSRTSPATRLLLAVHYAFEHGHLAVEPRVAHESRSAEAEALAWASVHGGKG